MVSTTRKVAGMPDLVLYKELEDDPGSSKEPSTYQEGDTGTHRGGEVSAHPSAVYGD